MTRLADPLDLPLIDHTPGHSPEAAALAGWSGIATHSHHLRGSAVASYPEICERTLQWCRHHTVRALGLGSPWEPVSAASYGRYEGPDRDRYYTEGFDTDAVKDEAAVRGCIASLDAAGGDDLLVYLDNETPKSRFGHLWWFGWHYDFPAWHDYSQDRPIQYYEGDPACELNALTGRPHRRRAYLEIVASQRAQGALGVWAHPTSWWTQDGAFITNIAAELPLHLLADGRVDGVVAMGYDAYHRDYQALWCHLLDQGYQVPGFAEGDTCFGRPGLYDRSAMLNYFDLAGKPVDLPAIIAAARRGACFMGTGARLQVEVDGVGMGAVCRTAAGRRHRLRITALPVPGQGGFSRLEVIGRGGRVRARVDRAAAGVYEFDLPGSDRADYVIVRATGETDYPDGPQNTIQHHVLSNPVYLWPAAYAPPAPMTTELQLRLRVDSPWRGGTVTLETAAGDALAAPIALDRFATGRDALREVVPASARLHLRAPSGETAVRYVAMENAAVQAHLRYLHDGEFRRDYPDLCPGQVPPAAFRLDAMREALSVNDLHL